MFIRVKCKIVNDIYRFRRAITKDDGIQEIKTKKCNLRGLYITNYRNVAESPRTKSVRIKLFVIDVHHKRITASI